MIVAYGGVITFLYIPKGDHHFFSFEKGGSCVFVKCFAGSYRPPSGRNNERSLNKVKHFLPKNSLYKLYSSLVQRYRGTLTLERGMGMCRGHDPLFSGHSPLPSPQIYRQCAALVPPVFNFQKNFAFSTMFWPKF